LLKQHGTDLEAWPDGGGAAALEFMAASVEARDAYLGSAELHVRQERPSGSHYPMLNAVVLDWVIGRRTDGVIDHERALRTIDAARVAAKGESCPSFWSRVTDADARLATALVNGSLPHDNGDIVDAYRDAFRQSSPSERVSVFEHLALITELLPADASERAAITELRDKLESRS